MSTKTEHYQLNQYEPGDNFLRTDFNEDNAKIDAALGEKVGIVFNSYIGTGMYPREFNLGFRPRAVYLENANGGSYSNSGGYCQGGFFSADCPLKDTQGNFAEITDTGFRLLRQFLNNKNDLRYYIAFR